VTGTAVGGPVTITATSEGKTGTSAVTVTPVPVASVAVTPATASIVVGTTVQLTAIPKDANGNPLTGRTVTWQSNAPGVASVDGSGRVQALATGSATITATSEGKSGFAIVSILPAPVARVDMSPSTATIQTNGTVQITATPKDANGNVLAGRTVTWGTSAPAVANVNGSGFVVGLAAGTATIRATSEGIVGTAAVTVQAASGPAVLAGAGDIADCSRASQEGTAKVLDGIVGQVATFGDGAYPNGSLTDYMNCFNPSWGRHKARTRPSTGNHEYNFGQAAGAPGYYAYWGAAAGDSGIGYYSYTLGAWHIVVINSSLDMTAGSTQEQWLRADLAAHPTTCTLAYWHHPRFSSGGNGSTLETQPIWQALYDYGAEVVVNGHDHDYERFAPQTPTGALDNTNGIREFVVGTGGNSLYSWPGNPIANSEVRSNVNYGVIKFTLWPTSYDWQFIPVAGGTFTDAGSTLCHSGTPPPNQAPVANPGGPYYSEGSVVLDGSQSRDPDNNTPITYAWDLGDGTTATTPTVTHTYPSAGSYVVTLTVKDSKGLSSTPASTSVTIGNLPPAVNAGPDQSVVGGTALSLQATFNDPGPTDYPWSYTISWGDGATDGGSTNTQVGPITGSHIYPAPGQYTTSVTVSDKYGAAGSSQFHVKVLDPTTVQVFSGASNIASCGTNEDEATAQIVDGLPGSVFVLGDNVNPSGSTANYTNCYDPTWGRHKARTHPVIGNHEYDVAGANGYFTYFGAAAGDTGKGYYSFDLGPYWHVIVLNNTASVANGAGSVEEQWLKADLAASTKPCTIAMFHYPLFFSSDDPSWHSASGVLPFWNDLYNANAEIVLNGQQYDYERFAPQDPGANLDPARGIREFNPGTGGYATSLPSSIAPNTEAISDAYGVLKLTLGPDSYIWDFIPAPGYTFTDHGSGNCH
jgi:PKD repeat protein